MSNSTTVDYTEEYLALIEKIGRKAPEARHHVERLPAGQTFRSFPSCKNEGPFIAIVTDTPVVQLQFRIGEIGPMIEHFHTGRSAGRTPLEALRGALAEYEASRSSGVR